MNTFQIECAKLALKRMMASGHFSICTVDEILKVTGGVPDAEDYKALRMLHCVDFKEFTPAMRIEFPGILKRVLESPSMELEITFKPLSRPPALISN